MPEPPAPTRFAKKLAAIAVGQYDKYHLIDENDPPLSSQIKKYWTTLGLPFPGVETRWSAVFVSFCVKTAGATAAEFKFAPRHSAFVHQAIQNALAGTGVFRGYEISERAVNVGDIIQNNRGGSTYDFEYAKANESYHSHSAIVVARGEDAVGKFAITVGGNESDSIRRKRVILKPNGTVRQRSTNPYICVIKNLK